jgi:integrating conjugative element protein (TIGR03749 family)
MTFDPVAPTPLLRASATGLVLLLLAWSGVPRAHAETVEWRNVPIPLELRVGEERVVGFPDHVQVGVPAALTPDVFRTQSTAGTALWLARRPFGPQRVQVRLLSTGEIMLFDVTAVEGGPFAREPVAVVFPGEAVQSGFGEAEDRRRLGPVQLTRFVAQQLYAPERLLRDVPGIRRVPMGVPETIPLYRDAQVIATPLASWRGGDLFVTAVKLRHLGRERVTLDPRLLRGRFVTAAFQHNSLGAAGSRSDTTCVYVVSEEPFLESIAGALPAAAASREGV